jgi:hypothetical protein
MMRRFGFALLTAGAAALAIGLAACGGSSRSCATGTVPDPGGANQCVPDGSVVCGNGTMYDAASGTCVVGGCPAGQVIVNGSCAANVKPDAEEAAEPNDESGAGAIKLPAAGDKGFVIHGCVSPRDTGATADRDPWVLTVKGPTLIDVTADGVGGLAAGFLVEPASPELKALDDNGWVRFGINLVDDTSHRQVYLPAAGTYVVLLQDSRQLFLNNAPAGSDKACYYATISQLAIPAPTAIAGAMTTGTIGGDVQFFSAPASDGDLFFANLTTTGTSANPALVAQLGGAYRISNDADTSATTVVAGFRFGGTRASDSPAVFVVDTQYNYALAPVPFQLSVKTTPAAALPTGGGDSTITQGDGTLSSFGDVAWYWFDVNAGDLVHLDLAFDKPANFVIIDSRLELTGFTGTTSGVGALGDAATAVSKDSGWYRFATAGRYYVGVFGPGLATGATFKMTATLTKATVADLAFGTPVTDHALDARNGEWFNVDPSAQIWITDTASGTNLAGEVAVDYYPRDGAGRIDADLKSRLHHTFAAAGGVSHGRITFGDPAAYVVRVSDAGAPPVAPTAKFTLSIAAQTFTDLAAVTAAAPVTKAGENLGGANKTKLYFVRGTPGDSMTITIHPTAAAFRPTVRRLDVDQTPDAPITAPAAGKDAVLKLGVPSAKWVAFLVTGTGATTTYDVSLTAKTPVPYGQTTGALPFTDVCNGGANKVTLTGTQLPDFPADDEGLSAAQTLGFPFALFGDDVTSFKISSNGFLSFGAITAAFPGNGALPAEAAPNGVLAPYWTDLLNVVVCMKKDANQATVQWTGEEIPDFFGDPGRAVAFQVVFHKDGKIDFIWGANQKADGDPATVGLENLFGTFGAQVAKDTAASVKPGTSVTFTPP